MNRLPILGVLVVMVSGLASLPAADDTPPPKKAAKEALQAFNDLIGSWRGTGLPKIGTKEEKDKNFWQETISWEWQFKDKDAWLKTKFEKGKYFDSGADTTPWVIMAATNSAHAMPISSTRRFSPT